MIIAVTCVIAIAAIAFVLGVRSQDLPEPEPESPFAHLDERKAAIYENLRDLQFEYRVGKLSDEDYQATKKDLQRELAQVMAEVDRLKAGIGDRGLGIGDRAAAAPAAGAAIGANGVERKAGFVCSACGAKFEKPLKFCGECGKAMGVAK
ncbi:MAG TPA: hypothetical protein VKX45_15675 [Bryobacteraceae bacterium]|jgi:hypothetical protein|nr:hypothetical protein [Bryobacteraceae bacterium]